MDLEEYKRRMEEDKGWLPGLEALEECVRAVYPDQEPKHYPTPLEDRFTEGGEVYLDDCCVYESPDGHLLILSHGMSNFYPSEEAFGGEFSGWGYEMTMRLPACEEADYMWAIETMLGMARYTYTTRKYLEPTQYFSSGEPIKEGSDSKLVGLIVVEDPQLKGADTPHGRLDFLQLVGITLKEMEAIMGDWGQIRTLWKKMRKDNPLYITDLARTNNYIEWKPRF